MNRKPVVDDETSSDDDDDFLPPVLRPRPAISTTSNQPGCSRDVNLSEIFPDVPADTLNELLNSNSDINEAANAIADFNNNTSTPEEERNDNSAPNITTNPSRSRHTLAVNEDTLFEDCFSYYKNPNFDPETPIRIKFENQPGIDAGGLTRQFFMLVSHQIIDKLFEGNAGNMLPKTSANTILSEIYVAVGKVIAHSIVHGCQGLPFLSPAVYNYICSGSISKAARFVTLEQVANGVYVHYIKEITDADSELLHTLSQDENLIQIIEEVGEVCILNETTKFIIIQSMMIHDIIVKRKASLDQLRCGLQILGVLRAITNNPDSMAKFFIQSTNEISPEALVSKLEFAANELATESNKEKLRFALSTFTNEDINKLLLFVTGTSNIFSLYPSQKIKVRFLQVDEICASTCDFSLVIPDGIEDVDMMKSALIVAMEEDKKKSFNTY